MPKPARPFQSRFRLARSAATASILSAFACGLAGPALAANHPEREWLVKDSAHFSLHYYTGLEKTAERILRDAETAYPKIAKDFGVALAGERIPIIITQDSFFNGEAEPVKDRITLDPVLANSSVVGTQRFVAHELAHVMTFRAVNLGNKLAQLSNIGGMPTWFLEGVAQYASEYWYPSNDRMLRLHTLENTLLTTSERANFRMLGLHAGASGYNEGYSLCRYMFDTHGRDKLAQLMANMKQGKRSFEQAVEATFGQNMAAVEAGWRQSLRDGYKKQIAGLQEQVPGATKLVPTFQGEVNVQPRWSPDGSKLAYLTSRYQDSFLYLRGNVMGFLSLFIADADGRNAQMLPVGKGAVNTFAWRPDGRALAYSRVVGDANGNPSFDLYLYDLASRTTTRLTEGENANTLAWRPGSRQLLYVNIVDGLNTVKVLDTGTKKARVLFQAEGDTQYRQPAFSPDGNTLALVTHQPGGWGNLLAVRMETGARSELTKAQPRVDDANPTWTPDGRRVVFSSDRGGMSNLYVVDVASKAVQKLTNTYRGAEMPAISPDGRTVAFTSYRSRGSEIFRMPLGSGSPVARQGAGVAEEAGANRVARALAAPKGPALSASQLERAKADARPPLTSAPAPSAPSAQVGLNAHAQAPLGANEHVVISPEAAGHAGTATPPKAPLSAPAPTQLLEPLATHEPPVITFGHAKPYAPTLTNDMIIPQMTSDEKGQQIGLAGSYSDILNKHLLGFDVRYGVMSTRFSYMLQYVNRMSTSSWMVSLFDQPQVALSPDVNAGDRSIYDSLYFQRTRGASLGLQTPLGSGRSLLSGASFGTLSTLMDPRAGNYGQLREGQLNTLNLGYNEQNVASSVDMDINPADGYRLGLNWSFSDARLGSAYNFSQYLFQGERYFTILPELRHNLAWSWNLGMINGDAVQPFLLGGATGSNPIFALRGYSVAALTGNRLASTGLEYTMPLNTHLDRMFGPFYMDRLYLTAFSDFGAAWNQGASAKPFGSVGAELRLKTSVMSRQVLTLRLGLAQKLGSLDAPGFYLAF